MGGSHFGPPLVQVFVLGFHIVSQHGGAMCAPLFHGRLCRLETIRFVRKDHFPGTRADLRKACLV